jgi:hypothetical protein
MVLGWSQRITPVVFVPAPSSETVKPAVRAKFPPLVIKQPAACRPSIKRPCRFQCRGSLDFGHLRQHPENPSGAGHFVRKLVLAATYGFPPITGASNIWVQLIRLENNAAIFVSDTNPGGYREDRGYNGFSYILHPCCPGTGQR